MLAILDRIRGFHDTLLGAIGDAIHTAMRPPTEFGNFSQN
ncbi:hypothetical protein SGPA1_10610 [Streptomyces misionensis JCM 4497]